MPKNEFEFFLSQEIAETSLVNWLASWTDSVRHAS